jgi:hypothetical protein
MKNKLFACLGTGAIALSLAILPSTLSASAQTTTDPVAPSDTITTDNDNYEENDGFDLGWLGLLGLIGLAGLKGRDRDHETRAGYTTPASTTSANNPRY